MSEHFSGKYEAELKFKLTDADLFLTKILAQGAEPFTINNREKDWYFDNNQASLNKQNVSMCVREMTPSGIKLWIVKGPSSSECKAINIDNCEHVIAMLETIGFKCVQQFEKIRSIYFLDHYHITIDHVKNVGDFAEFAIMTEDQQQISGYLAELYQLAATFGFDKTQIEKRSYKEIFQQTIK